MRTQADRKARQMAAWWAAWAVAGIVVALAKGGAPMWLRVIVGLLSLAQAFFAGLAIPRGTD